MSLVINVVGDTMIGRTFNSVLDKVPSHNVWGDTKKVLDTGHLVFANLETTLSDGNSENKIPNKPGGFYYHLKPEHARILKEVGVDYVSLANNHILDYQLPGLEQTVDTLDDLDISYSGAGLSLHEARRPAIFKLKLIPKSAEKSIKYNRIAIFSAADHYSNWQATTDTPGIWYIHHDQSDSALEFFRGYRKRHPKTFIVLSYHWGSNYEPKIPEWKRELAQKLFDAGVNLILGHSPHHLHHSNAVEEMNGKYVVYSLGDYVDDYAIDPVYRNDIGMIARITLDLEKGVVTNIEKYKTLIDNLQVNLL